jgi:hypothetical protein
LTIGYTAPSSSTEIISPSSNSDGDIIVKLTKSGIYTVKTIYYEGNPYTVGMPVEVSPEDVINGNHTAEHTIVVDPNGEDGPENVTIDGEAQD